MKKYSPFLFLVLMLAEQPAISSGTPEGAGIQDAILNTPEMQDTTVSKFLAPGCGAVIARIVLPDL